MAPKVTTSAERSKRKAKQPVRTDKGRNNRASVSEAKVTKSGDKPKGGARVTNAGQRTSTGSAPVTGGAKPVLPPGKPRPVRASIGNVSGPATTPKPPGTNANLRPGNSRTAPSIPKPVKPTVKPATTSAAIPKGAAIKKLLGSGLNAASGTEMLLQGSKELRGLLERAGFQPPKGSRSQAEIASREKNPSQTNGSKPKKPARPASDYEKLFQTGGGRANYGLDKKDDPVREREPVAPLPASVTPRSSGGGSSRSTPRSSASARSSTPTAPAKPGQKFADFNPGRGTSKTNNPLMKDMIKRMKDREDKEQASKAQQLTDKSRQNSGYSSAEKVDGSKYQEELKKKKGYKFSVE